MARLHDAHLTGMLAYSQASVERNLPHWLPMSMKATITELTDAKTSEVKGSFHELAASWMPSDKVHWVDVEGDVDQLVIKHACLFDVLVIGQFKQQPETSAFTLHTDRIAEWSGRPILLTPPSYEKTSINPCATIAWDGSNSASRAVMSALQLLKSKEQVHVISVDNGKIPTDIEREMLKNQLTRHDISAQFGVLAPKGKSVSNAILDFCRDVDAGLLISGAFGHRRIAENLFGGVTRSLMDNADIPVLMTH